MAKESIGRSHLGELYIGESMYLVSKIVQYEDGSSKFRLLSKDGDIQGSYEPNELSDVFDQEKRR